LIAGISENAVHRPEVSDGVESAWMKGLAAMNSSAEAKRDFMERMCERW
jgi:hypothetical protein